MLSFKNWLKITHGNVDEMTKQRIWNDCNRKHRYGEKIVPTPITMHSKEEDCDAVSDEEPDKFFDPTNFDDDKRLKMREMIGDRLCEDWYTVAPEDDDDLQCLE
ncbi:hypothetical protein CTI12_AA078380 [Artemisia annua]|uniref:Uncharacterized protein n=1 Tax=Artemisia annua TaxID=35608 RepID=A0A2U1Q3Q0_ARTAN|nr:hypothetical protein CTI12_AA078380 [Artemisia annua]